MPVKWGYTAWIVLGVGLLPFGIAHLQPAIYNTSFLIFELGCEIAAAASMGWALCCKPREIDPVKGVLLFGFILCLGVADWVYNVGVGLLSRYPHNYLGDFSFSLGMLLAACFVQTHFGKTHSTRLSKCTFGVCLTLFVGMHWLYILRPILGIAHTLPTSAVVNAFIYSLVTCYLAAFVVPASLRVLGALDTILCAGFVLLLTADFAQRYEATLGTSIAHSWAEPFWASGVGVIACALMTVAIDGRLPQSAMASWVSVRSFWGSFGLMANVILIIGLHASGHFPIVHGTHLTAYLLLVGTSWIMANIVGIKLSVDMHKVLDHMWLPQEKASTPQLESAPSARQPMTTWFSEINMMLERYDELARDAANATQELVTQRQQASVGRMALQVAHDIRSPLAVLRVVCRDAQGDAEMHEILQGAVERLEGIANDLLQHQRPVAHVEQKAQVPLAAFVTKMVAQKRLQHRSKEHVVFSVHVAPAAQDLVVRVIKTGLSRLLSNLIDNAVEALVQDGHIQVHVSRDGDDVVCCIIDNGAGMPPEILARMGERGATFGKASGHGLGVHHAHQTLRSWAGSLTYQSRVGQGTTACARLPAENP